jgi:hypothetical protein
MVNKTKANVRALLARLFICLSFGALFFAIAEVCQATFITLDYGCCERCSNYLFDRAQPVLAVCAALACFLYLWKRPASVSFKKSLRSAVIFSAAGFLGYFVFTGTNIYLRTECTALYSPGPGFLHSVAIGGPIVAFVVLIESAFWSSICTLLLLMLGVAVRVFRPAEPILSLSIRLIR